MTNVRPRAVRALATILAAAFSFVAAQAASAEQRTIERLTPVTDAMLRDPPAQDWLMWRRTLDAWGYSPLEQVDRGNVAQLQLVWTRVVEPGTQEGTPLVHDGVLFFPHPGDIVQALDAATGDLLWEHKRKLPEDIEKYINAPYINRNLAIYGHLIIDTSADGYVYALDARTGQEVWSTLVQEYQSGIHQTSGPIVADGKVFSGRGCEPQPQMNRDACVIVAHDAATGRELWRRSTIPAKGEPGFDSWGDVPLEQRKHVGAWMPPSYDPQLKRLYIGTSVTSPAPKFLLGGNDRKHLYHNSTLALDPETGKIVWYYQHLVDHWDLDHPFERILIDTEVAPAAGEVAWINPKIRPGERRQVLTGIPGKTGVVYTLDRRTGEFLWARPTVKQNVVGKIDGRTGEVTVDSASLFHKQGDSALVCPGATGGRNWPAGAYSPQTGAMYFPLQNLCSQITVSIASRAERSAYGFRATMQLAPGTTDVGSIHAIDVRTGRSPWVRQQRAATLSLATTGGGLLFGGDTSGRFRAFDARTGEVLWETNLGAPVTGFPMSYAVDGRQFVAVSVGPSVATAGYLLQTPEIRPSNHSALYVFALPRDWRSAQLAPRPAQQAGAAASPAAAPPPALPAVAQHCRRKPGEAASTATSAARFSRAQVLHGREVYRAQQCATCHGENLGGAPGGPPLADSGFRAEWAGRSMGALFDCLRNTMPPGRAGELPDADYAGLLSVILEANGLLPADTGTLPAERAALDRLRFDAGGPR